MWLFYRPTSLLPEWGPVWYEVQSAAACSLEALSPGSLLLHGPDTLCLAAKGGHGHTRTRHCARGRRSAAQVNWAVLFSSHKTPVEMHEACPLASQFEQPTVMGLCKPVKMQGPCISPGVLLLRSDGQGGLK